MKIGYIVSYYFGGRRNEHPQQKLDKLFYLKEQLHSLSKFSHSLDELIFVFNLRITRPETLPRVPLTLPIGLPTNCLYSPLVTINQDPGFEAHVAPCTVTSVTEEDAAYLLQASDIIKKHRLNKKCKITILTRDNQFGSYGAWDFALKEIATQFDYSILIEEDYVPYCDNFDKKFLAYFDPELANSPSLSQIVYVCQLFEPIQNEPHDAPGVNHGGELWPKHPRISNGMISNKIFDNYHIGTGKGFELVDPWDNNYQNCEYNQVHFLDGFINGYQDHGFIGDLTPEKGYGPYTIRHIADDYYVPFLGTRNNPDFSPGIEDYGNKDAEALLVPIWAPFVE